jgi:hypothetical protein
MRKFHVKMTAAASSYDGHWPITFWKDSTEDQFKTSPRHRATADKLKLHLAHVSSGWRGSRRSHLCVVPAYQFPHAVGVLVRRHADAVVHVSLLV